MADRLDPGRLVMTAAVSAQVPVELVLLCVARHCAGDYDTLVEKVQLLAWRLRWKPNAIRLLTMARSQIQARLGFKQDTGKW